MGLLRPRTLDDRGRKAPPRVRARDRLRRWGLPVLDALFVAGIFFIVLWPCVHFLEWFLLDAIRIERLLEPGTIVGGLLIAGVGLTVIMSLRTLTRSARERAKRRMAETIGRCAWCDYELDGLAPEADGCTVCPECGAAWRVEGTKS